MPAAAGSEELARHWDAVASRWPESRTRLWREQSDAINARLLDRWLGNIRYSAILKTDLFDELVSGGLYPLLRPRAARVVGVDISKAVVAAARRRYPELQSVVADVRALPYDDCSFDAAVSNSTLDHFHRGEQFNAAVRELARVLQPGAPLVITIDNPLNPLIALRNALPRRLSAFLREVPYESGWTCGPRTLSRTLTTTGFEVLERTAVLHIPRVAVEWLDRRGRPRHAARWLSLIRAGEWLERLPTRYLTGHFIAALALRR